MKYLVLIAFIIIGFNVNVNATEMKENLKKHVNFLASDSLEGRKAGTAKGRQAAYYVASEFETIGLKRFGDSYYHKFSYSNVHAQNVIGLIEAINPKYKDEYIVLGAHYDHIGFIIEDDDISLVSSVESESNGDKMKVCNGADDNASGVAALIELAGMLMANRDKLDRNVIIAAFDGEEVGLYGSRNFVKNPPVKLSKIKAMLNLDMIGRLRNAQGVSFLGFGSMEEGDDFSETIERVRGLHVKFEDREALWRDQSDHGPFYRNSIPCIAATTGEHRQYHKPEDDIDLINFEGLELICKQSYNLLLAMASKERYEFETTREWKRISLESHKFGLSLDYCKSNFEYSDGPSDGKNDIGGAVGLFYNTNLSKHTNLILEARYRYMQNPSFQGDLKMHSIEVPVKFAFSSEQQQYMPFRIMLFVGGDLHYSLGGTLGEENLDWANMGINQMRYSWNMGFRLEIFTLYLDFYFFNHTITPFFKDEVEEFGKVKLHNKIFSIGWAF